ncbi:Cation/H+ exchanger [Trinorchestia longiramus]|nr:Cation/H+ exchanger [Trinorchestia longiramus]
MTVVKAKDYILSVVAFFVVTLCGATIGLIFGLVTALVTRITTNVRVVEPLALLAFAYLSYLGAELFHFSGIISLIVCGLVQAQYAFQNISDKSYTCVKYFTKMAR